MIGAPVLWKAFKGELAPAEAELARAGGRSYETAAEMLERVKAEPAQGAGDRATPGSRQESKRARP